jgi:hypothetical protein
LGPQLILVHNVWHLIAQDLAKTNCVFVSPADPAASLQYVQLGEL